MGFSEPFSKDLNVKSIEKEYVIFCDESEQKGKHYSNFFGGVIVPGSVWESSETRLRMAAREADIQSEVKWSKVGPRELPVYSELLKTFFTLMAEENVRMRVMFRHNVHQPVYLSPEHIRSEYFILYYQFLKHGFDLQHMPVHPDGVRLRIYLDQLPDQTLEKKTQFRGYVSALDRVPGIRRKGVVIHDEDITEVDSKRHMLMQCMDVVLGSIHFRLNDKHKAKPAGQRNRGKRTIAKEKLYKFILKEIKRVSGKPGFNIGISTGVADGREARWGQPYLHWCFKPANFKYDDSFEK